MQLGCRRDGESSPQEASTALFPTFSSQVPSNQTTGQAALYSTRTPQAAPVFPNPRNLSTQQSGLKDPYTRGLLQDTARRWRALCRQQPTGRGTQGMQYNPSYQGPSNCSSDPYSQMRWQQQQQQQQQPVAIDCGQTEPSGSFRHQRMGQSVTQPMNQPQTRWMQP